MYVAILFILVLFIYTAINVVLVMLRNHKAHQFFKTRAPKLPVLEDPNIFSGHLFDVTFREKSVQTVSALHEKYGTTFGFYMCNQAWVSTKDLDLLKLIELDQPHKHINRAKFGLPFKEFNLSIFQQDDDAWRRMRRAVGPALTNHKVRSEEFLEDIEGVIEQLRSGIDSKLREGQLRDAAKKEEEDEEEEGASGSSSSSSTAGRRSMILNAGDMFQRYTLAVIFLVAYRREKEVDFCSDKDEWVERIDESARTLLDPSVACALMFPFTRPLIEFVVQYHPVYKVQLTIVDFIIRATDINRVAREQHQNLQRKLSEATGCKERPFSELVRMNGFKRRLVDTIIDALMEKRVEYDEFIGSTLFLLLAGFQTTAETITCLVWQLARAPEIQEKLRQSIREHGLDSEYLQWCVQETIRYHPAVPLGTGRILGEDVNVNGLHLPKGAFVMPSTHSIHHDASIWPEPEKFKPERWRHSADFHPAAFMGFGLGPRNCVGGKLAVQEIKLVIRMLLNNYKIETCSETPNEYAFSAPGLIYTNLDAPVKVRLVELEGRHNGEHGRSSS